MSVRVCVSVPRARVGVAPSQAALWLREQSARAQVPGPCLLGLLLGRCPSCPGPSAGAWSVKWDAEDAGGHAPLAWRSRSVPARLGHARCPWSPAAASYLGGRPGRWAVSGRGRQACGRARKPPESPWSPVPETLLPLLTVTVAVGGAGGASAPSVQGIVGSAFVAALGSGEDVFSKTQNDG